MNSYLCKSSNPYLMPMPTPEAYYSPVQAPSSDHWFQRGVSPSCSSSSGGRGEDSLSPCSSLMYSMEDYSHPLPSNPVASIDPMLFGANTNVAPVATVQQQQQQQSIYYQPLMTPLYQQEMDLNYHQQEKLLNHYTHESVVMPCMQSEMTTMQIPSFVNRPIPTPISSSSSVVFNSYPMGSNHGYLPNYENHGYTNQNTATTTLTTNSMLYQSSYGQHDNNNNNYAITNTNFHLREEKTQIEEEEESLSKDSKNTFKTTIKSSNGSTTGVIRRHKESHQDTLNSFPCTIPNCNKLFTRPYNLKSHMRTHTTERPYECKYKPCAWKFARPHDLKRHELQHTGHKPHECRFCCRRFARSDALKRHWKVDMNCAQALKEETARNGGHQVQIRRKRARDSTN